MQQHSINGEPIKFIGHVINKVILTGLISTISLLRLFTRKETPPMKTILTALTLSLLSASAAHASTPYMSTDWAAQACQGWNASAPLSSELGTKWIKNDKNRGYKIIHMYRTDCGAASKVEMKIASKDGKAMCTYGGPVATSSLDYSVDYLMHASTKDWKSDMNPATAMMFGALKFDGPKMEAMSVMGPFKAFMTLAIKVPGEAACPAK